MGNKKKFIQKLLGLTPSIEDADQFEIDTEGIREYVNQLDEKYGVNLKHPNSKTSPEECLYQTKRSSILHISHLIASIGNVDLTKATRTGKVDGICYPYDITNQEYAKESNLTFTDDGTAYDTDTSMFKCKFILGFLVQIKDTFGSIIKRMALAKANAKDRFAMLDPDVEKYLNLKDLIKDLDRFIQVFLGGESYGNILLKLHMYTNFLKQFDGSKVNKKIKETVETLKMGLHYTVLQERSLPDDIAIDTVLKLTFMLVTGHANLGRCLDFKYLDGATTEYDLHKVIEHLGMIIRKEAKANPDNLTYMYNAYIQAHPTLMTKYKKLERNPDLLMGVKTLSFTAFMCNDKCISRFIDEMLL